MSVGSKITEGVQFITNSYTKRRKAEERGLTRYINDNRNLTFDGSPVTTFKKAAQGFMHIAYAQASSDGKYPAHARQIMYAARGHLQARTGKMLDDQYFCQTLLPNYLRENPERTASWDVVFDARGHFEEPHTGLIVPLGTIDVRRYLAKMRNPAQADGEEVKEFVEAKMARWSTCGPQHRFSAVLFVEKEGFLPLFRTVKLAERFDLAIMSTKGLSVVASRRLVDRMCGEHDIPLLVLHDFDQAGFSILGTLKRNTPRYTFQNSIEIVDLGLRLSDVSRWVLPSEEVRYNKCDPRADLKKNGATKEEIERLYDGNGGGQRVELNAFSSGDFIEWIETKLKEQGIRKVQPDAETLEAAFRRACAGALLKRRLETLTPEMEAQATQLALPATLAEDVAQRLSDDSTQPWDAVIGAMAEEAVATTPAPTP